MPRFNYITTIFMIILVLSVGSCSRLFSTPISKILDNPRDYAGKNVTVTGEVTEVFSLFVLKYFVIDDGTGQITVITDKPLPKKGVRISSSGTVEEAYSIGSRQMIVIVEKESAKN